MTVDEKVELLSAFEEERNRYRGAMRILVDYWISDTDAEEIGSRGESPRRGRYIQRGANGIEHVVERCLASPLLAVVAADKRVYPCCNLRAIAQWAVGAINYQAGDTFEKVWLGEKRKHVMERIHNIECIRHCTHPMSRYNEIVEYLQGPQFHRGFV
jgi:hypothetical protein